MGCYFTLQFLYSHHKLEWHVNSITKSVWMNVNHDQSLEVLIPHKTSLPDILDIFLLENCFHYFPGTQYRTSRLHVTSYTWQLTITCSTSTKHSYRKRNISQLEPPDHQYMFGDLYGPPRLPLPGPLLLWIRPRPRWNMPPRLPRFWSWPLCGAPRVLMGRPLDCWIVVGDGPSHTMGWILGFSALERKYF